MVRAHGMCIHIYILFVECMLCMFANIAINMSASGRIRSIACRFVMFARYMTK